MSREVTMWECGICGKLYKGMTEADQCEAQGAVPDLPVGLIFAIPKGETGERYWCLISTVKVHGHKAYMDIVFFGPGETTLDHAGYQVSTTEPLSALDVDPSFAGAQVLAGYASEHGWPVTYWARGRVMSLEELREGSTGPAR